MNHVLIIVVYILSLFAFAIAYDVVAKEKYKSGWRQFIAVPVIMFLAYATFELAKYAFK